MVDWYEFHFEFNMTPTTDVGFNTTTAAVGSMPSMTPVLVVGAIFITIVVLVVLYTTLKYVRWFLLGALPVLIAAFSYSAGYSMMEEATTSHPERLIRFLSISVLFFVAIVVGRFIDIKMQWVKKVEEWFKGQR